jgi:hypothetical protein
MEKSEEHKESKEQKVARVLRSAYERLAATGTPELDRELKDLVDEHEKSAGIEFVETRNEPPIKPERTGDVGQAAPREAEPFTKTPEQIRAEQKYKQEHRGEISQRKHEEAMGRDFRGQVKEEAEKSDAEQEKQKHASEQSRDPIGKRIK